MLPQSTIRIFPSRLPNTVHSPNSRLCISSQSNTLTSLFFGILQNPPGENRRLSIFQAVKQPFFVLRQESALYRFKNSAGSAEKPCFPSYKRHQSGIIGKGRLPPALAAKRLKALGRKPERGQSISPHDPDARPLLDFLLLPDEDAVPAARLPFPRPPQALFSRGKGRFHAPKRPWGGAPALFRPGAAVLHLLLAL